MTQQETLEYNKRCAEFLGMHISVDPADGYDTGTWYKPSDIEGEVIPSPVLFHSDWNWIMEVKEKICQLDIIDEFNTLYDSVAKGYHCVLLPTYKNTFDGFYTKVINTEKEAVVKAINQFLIWYEQNKFGSIK